METGRDVWRWCGDVWRTVETCGDVWRRGGGQLVAAVFREGSPTEAASLCYSNPPSQHSFGQVSLGKWFEISALFLRSKSALIPQAEETKASEPRALNRVQGLSATRALLNDLLYTDTNRH